MKTLNAKNAIQLDKDLMSVGAFSIDQLMELAGLSVSQAGDNSPDLLFKISVTNISQCTAFILLLKVVVS